jgi:glycosyltransferase involved in cell wall biosynthesis
MKPSVSIFIPAYNEEKNIKDAIQNVGKAVAPHASEYEILVVDDGSTDSTADIVKEMMKKDTHIKLIQNSTNESIGPSLIKASKVAKYMYYSVFPGDNDMKADVFEPLLKMAAEADLIICYPRDTSVRSPLRQLLSRAFVQGMNIMFGVHLRYFTGPYILKTELVRSYPLKTQGFTIYAELKIRPIRDGHSYKEIPFDHIGRAHGNSKALSLKSIWRTVSAILWLWVDLVKRSKSPKVLRSLKKT